MPIRFRCVYCNKLLGIARRKAGAVVSCPQCSEQLIVPSPESEIDDEVSGDAGTDEEQALAAAATAPAGRLFEKGDIDAILRSDNTLRTDGGHGRGPAAMTRTGDVSAPLPLPAEPPASATSRKPAGQTAPFLAREEPRPPGYFISTTRASWLGVAAVIVVSLAFGAGLIVGRMIK